MRKLKRSTLKRKCDKIWSQIILSKGKCEVCGKSNGVLHPHHVVGRKNLTLRFDPRNGVCLCFQHHTGGKESAHNDPLWFQQWLTTHRRADYNYLMFKRMELSVKLDYEEVLKRLQSNKN